MHRIDGYDNVAGMFSEGDSTLGTNATQVTDDWLNATQEEIAHVIEATGTVLNKADNTQLYVAILSLLSGRLGTLFKPGPESPASMKVVLAAGHVFKDGTLTEVAQQTTTAFTAPGSNSRIDRIVVDRATGAYSVVAGTASATPVAPAIPTGKNPVAQVHIASGATSITAANITDERALFSLGLGMAAFAALGGNVTNSGGNLSVAAATTSAGGVIEIATDAEAAALSDTGRAIVPSNLAALFAKSLATSGYQKLPGGLIVQWGALPSFGGNSSSTITFPIAFPTSCFGISTTPTANDLTFDSYLMYKSLTATSVLVGNGGPNGTSGGMYIAIGY